MSSLLSFLLRVLTLIICPLIGFAQINDEGGGDRTSQSTSTIKFRGYQSATEDLPFMSEDWKVTFFQLAATEPARFDDKKATTFFFYNYFSFNYKIDDDSRFAMRPVFTLESPGVNKYNDTVSKWNFKMGDWYLQYSRFNLFEVGPFASRTNVRLYAPTSDPSQKNGMIAQVHPELYIETSLWRGAGVEIAFKGDYYFHSQKAYSFTTESGKTIYTTNKEMELESYVEYNQKLNSKFNLKPRLTWFDEWKHRSPQNGFASTHETRFSAGLGLDWHPSEDFNTTVIFSNETTYYGNRSFIRKEKHFDPNNNQLVALTNYRF